MESFFLIFSKFNLKNYSKILIWNKTSGVVKWKLVRKEIELGEKKLETNVTDRKRILQTKIEINLKHCPYLYTM